jgi:TolB-like protein/class 3 adenylate cyclase/Tfp pilus assembly protein PilF
MERRLAAVLIADVVGYGRHSQVDEEGTRARFRADVHEILEPKIAAHGGRLIKTMGDGLLVEFHSVVEALRCAVDVQRAKAERNGAAPAGHRLDFRIGINLGDVIVEGDDIHGDGVNIADRLQGLAEPGGIAISGTAYDHVHTKLPVGFDSLGERLMKNIAEPVRVYRVVLDTAAAGKTVGKSRTAMRSLRWPAAAAAAILLLLLAAGAVAWWRSWQPRIEPASIERMALPLPDKPSIAVLPFANMSDDAKQEYFADGITDDLITELSKVSGLFVISRNSTFVYRGRSVPTKQVSEELGVRYVLEGSVQRAGDQLRINAQLIDALDGGHVWADRFDGSLIDVFALQDKVASSIADALAVRLTAADRIALDQHETSVPAAYDAFLRGWLHLRRDTPQDYAKAVSYLEAATKLDPDYGRAYAALAMVYIQSFDLRWTVSLGLARFEARQTAWRYLKKGQEHPTALSHQVAAMILWLDGQPDKALAEVKASIALDPGDALSYAYMGVVLISLDRPAEAVPAIRTAMRLDPHYPPLFEYFLGLAQFALERFEEAAASFATVTRLNPEYDNAFAALAAAYGHLGRKPDAASAIAQYNDIMVKRGGVPIEVGAPSYYNFNYYAGADVDRLRDGLRLAGAPEFLFRSQFAEQNRLTADQIRTLVFGHRLHGRSIDTGKERVASVSSDGIAALSGSWGLLGGAPLTGGSAQFEGDRLCYKFDFVSYCGDVFRNPGGTRAKENEFIWYNAEAFTFSQIE